MEVQDGLSLRVLCQHFVHPGDLLITDAPAHVDHDEVDTIHRDQIIMTAVVFVAAAVPWISLVAALAEILGIIGVVAAEMSDIVVAGQHAVWKICIIQHLVGTIRILPFRDQRLIIDDVTVMEHVLNVHALPVVEHPVVDIQLILVLPVDILARIAVVVLIVVLGITFDDKGEIVIVTRCIVLVVGRIGTGFSRAVLRRCVAFSVLYHDAHLLILHIVVQRQIGRQRQLAVFVHGFTFQAIPCAVCPVVGVQERLVIVGHTAPAHLHASCLQL